MASIQGLAEGAGGEEPDDRRVKREQADRREEIADRAALEEHRFQDREIVARRDEIGEPLDRRRHLLNGKGEAREQRRRQERRDQRDLARADLAADAGRDEIAEAQHDDQKKRGGEEQGRDRPAKRRLEPEDRDHEAERGVDQADEEIRQDLPSHQLIRVTGVETRTSIVPRSHSREIVSEASRAPTSAITSATTRRHDVISTDQTLVLPDPVLGDRRDGRRRLARVWVRSS